MYSNETYGLNDIAYWREKLFAHCILYCVPISLFAIIPGVIITMDGGHLVVPVVLVLALIAIMVVVFNKKLKVQHKKTGAILVLYLLAILLMVRLGDFGVGAIILLTTCVCTSLLFSDKIIYSSVICNFLILMVFALIIEFKWFDIPVVHRYKASFWIGYSLTFVFLNIVAAIQIRNVIAGLEGALIKETRLLQELQLEMEERIERNELLSESEGHYRSLFFLNPSPMWIFDRETSKFLQVNQAAIHKYGYSEQEFLNMSVTDIGPEQTAHEPFDMPGISSQPANYLQQFTQHSRKDGQEMDVDVRRSTILFKGREASLAIVRDITTQITHLQAIEKQNAKLREIAYMQSHIVRAPLSRILGIIELITHDTSPKTDPNLIEFLSISAGELDAVIKDIVDNSQSVQSVPSLKDLTE